MSEIITVENTEMSIREYNGQRVVTLKDIDRVHGKKSDTAKKSFQKYKKHFIVGEDYFEITRKELGEQFSPKEKIIGNPNLKTYLFTESGYLMIVKAFTDDLAWDVQRKLVNSYFKLKEVQQEQTPPQLTVKKQRDWWIANQWKLEYVCDAYDCTPKTYMHHLLQQISATYDFDDARATYIAQTGDRHCTNGCVIMFFPEVKKLADDILEFDIKRVAD